MSKLKAGVGDLFKRYSIIDARVMLPKTERRVLGYSPKNGWKECSCWLKDGKMQIDIVDECAWTDEIIYWVDMPTINTKDGIDHGTES